MNEKLEGKIDTHSETKEYDENPIGVYRFGTAGF